MSWSKGENAEYYVAAKLIAAGWTIEARNFRRRGFEIDIIATRPDRLLCIEVKARRNLKPQLQDPAQLLNLRKIDRLHKGMRSWLQEQSTASERRNPEFWLCLLTLPIMRSGVEWFRLEQEERSEEKRSND